jgi:hypothetical protein
MSAFEDMKQDLRDFKECYLPKTKIWRFIGAIQSFLAPDDAKAEIDALDFTIADLERQRRIITQQLSILRFERTRKMQELK